MTRVSCICLYLDQKLDESYSPSRISIRVGNGSASADVTPDGQPLQQGIREMDKFDIEEPQGWLVCHLTRKDETTSDAKANNAVRCHFVQVVVLNSYQNGRDTHIRQVKVFGPRQWSSSRGLLADLENFTSPEFKQFSSIR
jgi:anaphase-promoting complex subunit 10